MAKKTRSLRLSEITWRQLDELSNWLRLEDRTKVIEVLAKQEHKKMTEMQVVAKTVTVTMTWERLAAMYDGGLALFATPGDNRPYWSAQPGFMYDEQVATIFDFQTGEGLEFDREPGSFDENEIFTATVGLLPAR